MTKFTYYSYLSLSVVSMFFALGIGYVYITQENSGYPLRGALVETQGYVSWVEKYKYGIRFGLTTSELNFVYPSKANGQGVVLEALLNSKGKQARFSYLSSEPKGPLYNDVKYYTVFELFVENIPIRTYEQTEKAWKGDNKLTPFIFVLFFGGSIYIWRKTKRGFQHYY